MSADFPVADRNRSIREASDVLFRLLKPIAWHSESFGGEDDFGLDVHVQVSDQAGVKHAFYIQLKGTEHPDISADRLTLRYPLKRTTLNYYASLTQEVMLIVCVVVFRNDGGLDVGQSRAYWQWISAELKERRGSEFEIDVSEAQTTTVHIPLVQVLSPSLNVSERLFNRLSQLKAFATLEGLLSSSLNQIQVDSVSAVAQLSDAIRSKPSEFAAFVSGQFDVGYQGFPDAALEVKALIRAGHTEQASSELEKLGVDGLGTLPAQRALWLSLCGKVAMQRRDHNEALRMFEAAYAADRSEAHLLALAETKFLAAVDGNCIDAISAIRGELISVQSDAGLALLVRVLVALKEFDEASDCVSRITASKQILPKLVVLSGRHQWDCVIVQARTAEQNKDVSESDRTAIQLVAARAAWFKALEPVESYETTDELPLSGPVGIRQNAVRDAWGFSKACISGLRANGWSPNIELLAPVVCAVAGVLGVQEEAISLLSEAAAQRHAYLELQYSFELLAMGAGKLDLALKANRLQPITDEAALVRRASILFSLRKHAECVSCAIGIMRSAGAMEIRSAPMALAMGYASARKLARMLDADELRSALVNKPDWSEFVVFAEFLYESVTSPKTVAGLDYLRTGILKTPDSWLLASNLFSNLDVGDISQATEAVNLQRLLTAFDTIPAMPEPVQAISFSDALHGIDQGLLQGFR